jgi:hypothetical protein
MHYGENRTLLADSVDPRLHFPIGKRRKLSPLAEGMFIVLKIGGYKLQAHAKTRFRAYSAWVPESWKRVLVISPGETSLGRWRMGTP